MKKLHTHKHTHTHTHTHTGSYDCGELFGTVWMPLIRALLPEWFVPSKVPEALPHFVVLSTQFLLLAFVLPGLGALPRRFCPSCRPARQPLFTLLPIFLLKFPAVDLPLLFVPSLGRRGLEADGVTTILSFLVLLCPPFQNITGIPPHDRGHPALLAGPG